MACSFLKKLWTPDVKEELLQILRVAWPLIMASLWSYLLAPISLMFVGHLGTATLDGVSIAGSLINISGISIVTGISAACDTFFSQTFGSGNYYQLGIYLQRSILVCFLSILPCYAFQVNARAFLTLIAQDEEVSLIAANYLDVFSFGLPGCFAFILLSKYLQNQDILYPTIIIGAIGNAMNALLHYIFVWVMELDYRGSAYAMATAFDIMGVMSVGYILLWKVYDNQWPGWGRHSLMEWGPFMKLALPSLIMICVEAWTIEVGVFLSGLLNVTQQSAQSVLFQIQTIADMLTIGFGSASAIRVGQHLGRGDWPMAKTSAILCILVTVVLASMLTTILGGFSMFIPKLFTNDPEVEKIVARLLPVLGAYAFTDALSATGGGIVRGCGRQLAGSLINMFGYYVIALPVGIPLMFVQEKIDPLWFGLFGGLAGTAIIYLIVVAFTHWEKQADAAAERANLDNQEDETAVQKAESLIASYAGRRTTWATVSDHLVANERRKQKRRRESSRNKAGAGGRDYDFQESSFYESSNKSYQSAVHASVAPDDEQHHNEATGIISGKPQTYYGAGEGLDQQAVDPLGMPGQQVAMLYVKRLAAVVICSGVLAASVILRLTVFDWGPIENGNMTTLPFNGTTITTTPLTSVTTPVATTTIANMTSLVTTSTAAALNLTTTAVNLTTAA